MKRMTQVVPNAAVIVVVAVVAIMTAGYALAVGGTFGDLREVLILEATLAELQQSTYPEAHPYFWFCPSDGECAEDGYLAWYSAHGGS